MHKVGVTTLLCHADDDPVVSASHTDWRQIHSNKHFIILHTKRGGHVGWYKGLFPTGSTYCNRISASFISAVLESQSQTNFLVDVLRRALLEDEKATDEQERG